MRFFKVSVTVLVTVSFENWKLMLVCHLCLTALDNSVYC